MTRPNFDPPGTAARRAALRLLDAVLRRGLPIEAALDGAAGNLGRREDRALAHAIAAEALRWLPDLDALIDSATARPLPDDAKARSVLRIALVQVLRLATPPHAAIATALPLVDGGPRKLVHGVFGALMRRPATLPERPTLPAAVADRWRAAWGDDRATAAAHAIAAPPPLDLTLRSDDAVAPEGHALLPRHRRLDAAAPVPSLDGYDAGGWWVQDIAASLPARLLGTGRGKVLDLCAAPGGKTLQLAAAGWDVTAVDISESRLARLRDNLARTGLQARVVTADLLRWEPDGSVDAILLDAPCSATGIFRRHPDVLHRVRPRLIDEMAALQATLLVRAAKWLKPGGTIVYATCSLEPAEGETQLGPFLAEHTDFEVDRIGNDELPDGIAPADAGYVRTLPGDLAGVGGCDGFFIVRLVRRG